MINSNLSHVKTLDEFITSIRQQQEAAHGEKYCAIHDAIRKYMQHCDSYMELGTHQGGTASVAISCNPSKVYLIDLDLSRYNSCLKSIAESYCTRNGIKLVAKQASSIDRSHVNDVDMLMIDSRHQRKHMLQELAVHGSHAHKYIIAHDTSIINGRKNDELYRTLKEYATTRGWIVLDHCTDNVGYTVIGASNEAV